MSSAQPVFAASPSPPPPSAEHASSLPPVMELKTQERSSNPPSHSVPHLHSTSPIASGRKPRGLSISTRVNPPIPPPQPHDPPRDLDQGGSQHYTCDHPPSTLADHARVESLPQPLAATFNEPAWASGPQQPPLAEAVPTWGPVTLYDDPVSVSAALSSKVLTPEQVKTVQQALEQHLAIGDSIMEFGLAILDMDRLEQFGLLLAMARRLRIPSLLRVTLDQLLDWAVAVDSLYLPNPYHSFAHAVDVTFMCFFTFVNLHAADLVTDLEQTALFFAALCHDLGHPGKNNTFMINTKHSLAARYQNQSVLENYSVDLGRDLMLQHGLLAHMSGATRDVFIDLFTDLILGTDMSKHFLLVKELGELSRQLLHADHLVTLAEEEQQGSGGSLNAGGLGDGRPEITIAPAATQRDAPVMLSQSVVEALDRIVRGSPSQASAGTSAMHVPESVTAVTDTDLPQLLSSSSATFPEPTARRLSSSKSATFYSQRQDEGLNPVSLISSTKIGLTAASTNVLSPAIQLPWAPLISSSADTPTSSSDVHTHATCSTVDLSGPATGARADAFSTVQLLTATQRRNLVKCALHAADISNTVRPWDLCKRWSDLVEKEHFAQGDAELALGFALSSPNMDRRNCQQAKVSMDFSDVIIHPFFVLLSDVLPGTELYLDQLAVNRALWEQIRERDKMQRAAASKAAAAALVGHGHEMASSAYASMVTSPTNAPPTLAASSPVTVAPAAVSGMDVTSTDALATTSTDSIASSTTAGHGNDSVTSAGYARGRRVSVAAGTIVIPEHYFRAAATTPLLGSPTDATAPHLMPSSQVGSMELTHDHAGSFVPSSDHVTTTPSQPTVTPPPRSTTPPIPIPSGMSSISLPNTPISGPRSTARSSVRTSTDMNPSNPLGNDDNEFDALYLEYLARAQSRRRATHASLHMDPHAGLGGAPAFPRMPHHSTSVPAGALFGGSQSHGGSRSLSPVSGAYGTSPLSSAGAAADPMAFRRYSLEASERQRRRKSTVALRQLPLLTSAHVIAGTSPSLASMAISLPVPNGVPFMSHHPGMAVGLSPSRLSAGSPSRRATSLDNTGIAYPGHGISYSLSALGGSPSPLSPIAHALASPVHGQGSPRSHSGACDESSGQIPPVPPVPSVFSQGFYIATRGVSSPASSALAVGGDHATLMTPQSEGPLEPATTPVTGMTMAARLLRGSSSAASPAPTSSASDPGPSHQGRGD